MASLTSMNVRRLRSLLWVLTIGLLVVAGLQVMRIFEAYKSGRFEPRAEDHFRAIIAAAEQVPIRDDGPITPSLTALAGLWEKPLNGYVPPKVEPKIEQPKEVERKADPIENHIILLMVTEDPISGGLVSVKYKDEKDVPAEYRDETLLAVGSPLKYPYDEPPFSASVKQIDARAVVFEWAGEVVEMSLPNLQSAPLPSDGISEASIALSDDEAGILERYKDLAETTRIAELSKGEQEAYRVGTSDLDAFAAGDDFRNFVRLGESSAGTGGGQQVRLSTVKGAAVKYGVEQGDVLISINNAPVTSKTQAIQWARNHPNEPKYEVKLQRKGREVVRVYYPPED